MKFRIVLERELRIEISAGGASSFFARRAQSLGLRSISGLSNHSFAR